MGSEDTIKLASRRAPMMQMVLVAGFAAVAVIWCTLSSPHLVTDREAIAALTQASQIEVERYCSRELVNVVAIQQELRSLGEEFDNIKAALAPSHESTFEINTDAASAAILPGLHHRRHRRNLHSRAQTSSTDPNNHFVHPLDRATQPAAACPRKLAATLAAISSWLGALHTEVLALKRRSSADGGAAQGRAAAEGGGAMAGRRAGAGLDEARGERLGADSAAAEQLELALLKVKAAVAAKEAAEQELAAAKLGCASAEHDLRAVQQKLAVAMALAVPGQEPSGHCWVPHKSDGVLVNRTMVQGSPVYMDHVRQSMVVPVNDEWVSRWIVTVEAPFDTQILERMLDYIRPGDVVLDIGANLGTYSIWFAHKVGATGAVWAFEPQPYVYQVLCTNVVINGHRNIRTVNAALSFRAGMASMDAKVPDGTSAGKDFTDVATNHTTKVNYGGRRLGTGGEKVPMQQLDDLRLPKVSFMKIDVQGAEPLVLWGARETIKRTLPVVNFEVSPGYPVTPAMKKELRIPDEVASFEITAWLKSIGYRFMEKVVEDQFWVPPGWVPPAGWNTTESSNTASSGSGSQAKPGQPRPPAEAAGGRQAAKEQEAAAAKQDGVEADDTNLGL